MGIPGNKGRILRGFEKCRRGSFNCYSRVLWCFYVSYYVHIMKLKIYFVVNEIALTQESALVVSKTAVPSIFDSFKTNSVQHDPFE